MANRDWIAKEMGDLLLKGYRMLDINCETCNNILMQDKKMAYICIYCRKNPKASEDENKEETFDTPLDASEEKKLKYNSNEFPVDEIVQAKRILLKEIYDSSQKLNSNLKQDILCKQTYVRYIRECAETINALQIIEK